MLLQVICFAICGKTFSDEYWGRLWRKFVSFFCLQLSLKSVSPSSGIAFTLGMLLLGRGHKVVGFFGGHGLVFKTKCSALRKFAVGAIILSIILLVLIAEFLSGLLRSAVDKAK